MPEYRNDISGSSFRKNRDGGITVSWESRAAGWAYPGEAQEIGPFYLKMFSGNLEQAFEEGVWRMYDSIDLKAVSDTPEWFRDAVVYSFHGGGTIGSGWKDLGGFVPARQELLPRIGQLGFNLIWLLPLEDGHVYWPRDYYKVREDLGNADDLKAFVAAVHDRKMRILFDCVPHGGTPANGALRGNKPWELIFDEQGNAYSYWCFDFGNPDYQKYIAGVVDHKRTGFAFAGSEITRWQVSTAEGLLDDFFVVRHLSGTPNQTMPEGILYYRLTGTPVMWQSETNPLNFENPSIVAFSGESGVEFSLCDPLDGELRNAMVLDKLAGKPGWHAAFFWNDVQPYSSDAVFPESIDPGKREFSLVLKTIDTPLPEAETTAWTQLDGLRFRNVSRGWVVENDHYSVELLRCGGVMASLRSRGSDQELLRGNRVYTDRGFRRKWGPKNMNASSAHDGETGVRIYYEDGKLHMRFVYSMREPGRRWLPEPMLWGETEYVFDRSESFQVRWNLVSVGRPHDTPALLGWELASDNWMSSVFRQDGREIASGLGVKITPAQGTAAVRPDEVEFLNRDGGMMLKLSEIHYPGDAPAQSVTLQDSVFTIACLDGTADDIEPGKRYETSLKVSVGK